MLLFDSNYFSVINVMNKVILMWLPENENCEFLLYLNKQIQMKRMFHDTAF